tara:strand:- start:795 stop:905 length:111 start_codon:yes stop_codon:yes gene_type:complete
MFIHVLSILTSKVRKLLSFDENLADLLYLLQINLIL